MRIVDTALVFAKANCKALLALLAMASVFVLVPLAFGPDGGASYSSVWAQGKKSLDKFLGRSPGERTAVLQGKGKGKGKSRVLAKGTDVTPAEQLPSFDHGPYDVALVSSPLVGPPVDLVNPLPPIQFSPSGGPRFAGLPIFGPPSAGGPFVSPPPTGGGGESPPTGAVPEPATWALMIVGFGLCGAAMRRKGGRRGAARGISPACG